MHQAQPEIWAQLLACKFESTKFSFKNTSENFGLAKSKDEILNSVLKFMNCRSFNDIKDRIFVPHSIYKRVLYSLKHIGKLLNVFLVKKNGKM